MGSPGPDLPLVCFATQFWLAPSLEVEKGVRFSLPLRKKIKSEKHLALFDNKIDMLTRMLDSVGLGLRFRLG